MTIEDARSVIETIKFPNAMISLSAMFLGNIFDSSHLRIAWDVQNSSYPYNQITVYSTKIIELGELNAPLLQEIIFTLIKDFLIHDASEKFTVNGTIPYNPHLEEHHDAALEWENVRAIKVFLGMGEINERMEEDC